MLKWLVTLILINKNTPCKNIMQFFFIRISRIHSGIPTVRNDLSGESFFAFVIIAPGLFSKPTSRTTTAMILYFLHTVRRARDKGTSFLREKVEKKKLDLRPTCYNKKVHRSL